MLRMIIRSIVEAARGLDNEKGEAAGHSPESERHEAIPARLDPLVSGCIIL
jgi:hypothetical protein